jgi:hypothetical protein
VNDGAAEVVVLVVVVEVVVVLLGTALVTGLVSLPAG